MKYRWITVDPMKLKKFLNVMLQVPKLRVQDAMKLANFSDEDIADLSSRCFHQLEQRMMQQLATMLLIGSASHTCYKKTRTACPG
jgi:hypothetical protein